MLEKQTIDQVKAGEIILQLILTRICACKVEIIWMGFTENMAVCMTYVFRVVSDHDTVGYVDMEQKVTYL